MRTPKPRKVINDFQSYVPGMSIEKVKALYGITQPVKLASNENLWGTSDLAVQEIKKNIKNIHIYPESEPEELKKTIAEKFSVSAGSVIFGNGTDELIELIGKTFLDVSDSVLVSKNSFIRYKMAGKLMGVNVVEVPQKNLRTDIESIISAVDMSTKVIFIDNPCNPTGTFVTGAEIEKFLDQLSQKLFFPLVVFDEAYFEYAIDENYCSALEYFDAEVPLIILRTFSKIYGLAGLRIGYGISSEDIISYMNRIRPPFNTNRIAQAAAVGAIKDDKFLKMISVNIETEKQFLYRELDRLRVFFMFSQTNFILIKIGSDYVNRFCEYILIEEGLMLRPLVGYELDDYIRITIGKREHNQKLINALEGFIKKEIKK